jgi:hypothetical protein
MTFLIIAIGSFCGWTFFQTENIKSGSGGAPLKWYERLIVGDLSTTWSHLRRDEFEEFDGQTLRVGDESRIIARSYPFATLNKSFFEAAARTSSGTKIKTLPTAFIAARRILDKHPFNRLPDNMTLDKMALEEAMFYLFHQPQCKEVPIFTSMAQVGNDLYWQLIENFIYTMVKFSLSDCSVMICVTDQHCMDMCKKSGFPCLHYDHNLHNPGVVLPSALEQIAHLKLQHLPKALARGVSFQNEYSSVRYSFGMQSIDRYSLNDIILTRYSFDKIMF